ncbi:MAG: type II toxin-antitoxin system death-on-curing family toxin [bacterium]|nr:type II toxin-antitoxin system death-on-curing family toxin [bacterium]
MRYLTLGETLALHHMVMRQSGGCEGLRDINALESAISQPRMTFGGEALYQTMIEKASALGFSIIMNHPFIDGNKRTGHAAMEVFLILNGFEINASVEQQEKVILALASGNLQRDEFTEWLRLHLVEKT